MLKRVKLASIPVKDQDRALKFYTDVMGFRIITDAPFDDKQRWIELQLPGGETSVVLFTPTGHESLIGSFSNITFECDRIKETYEDLKKKGVEFVREPTKEDWGSFFIFKDIDGNQFCVSAR
ncbi:MAG: VOC family protein [Candidatus Melainabacteria bacterium]|nr:VOC family protein [Candidatus Melainabacteria bacterium]